MNCCEIYQGVFGDWGWEHLSRDGELIEESRQVFENLEDCVEDARLHGYCVTQESAGGQEARLAA